MRFILVMKNVIVCECVLCVANREPVFIRMVNEGDVGVFTVIFVFHHDTRIEVMNLIIRTDTKDAIFDGDGFGVENGRVTTQSKVTQEFSFGGVHDVCASRCEING